MIVSWTEAEIAAMPVERCRELSTQIKGTLIASADSPQYRRDTLNMLRALDKRIAGAPASVEQRVDDARTFLHPPAIAADARARAWLSAVELHGSAAEAKRRGYSDPSENAA